MSVTLFAVAAPGLAGVLGEEIRALPEVAVVTVEEGGVSFSGPAALIGRANLHLRTATRVLLRLARFSATRLPQLIEASAAVPWERYLRAPQVQARVTCHQSRIYHSGAAAERLELGIARRLAGHPAGAAATDLPLVLLRGVKDQWELSLDTSGALLHQRGYRTEAGEAPLRETLAAGLLLLAGYQGGPLLDLCCGSGTFLIEAALLRGRVAPGLQRGFAFSAWPDHDEAAWQRLRAEARAQQLPPEAEDAVALWGVDLDPQAVALAQRSAARAGVRVALRCADLFSVAPGRGLPDLLGGQPWSAALVCANPPYGRRLGQRREQFDLYRQLGRHLRQHFAESQALVLCGSAQAAEALRLPLATLSLHNGGLPIKVRHGRLAPRSSSPPPAPPWHRTPAAG